MKSKIVIILGPTASGKSDLAVALARQFNGEVVSADSRQIYKGMDLGTGKITTEEMRSVPHHLLDVAEPKDVYSVANFQKTAQQVIDDILSRERLPVVAGGTGFYIQSIVDNIALPEVPPNPKLREELEKKSTEEIFEILLKIDPKRASEIDKNNPHRLIRAVEIAKYLGKVPPLKKEEKYDALQIGIAVDYDELEQKIALRLKKRIDQGMIAEVKNLHEITGVTWERLESFGLEYAFIAKFLQNKISETEMLEGIKTESLKYAKRQMTWFNKDKRIVWINNADQATNLIKKFLIGSMASN